MVASKYKFSLFCIISCMLVIVFDWVTSKPPRPSDRPYHRRPHNLHRAPYNGYEWYHDYKLNFDPIVGRPKQNQTTKSPKHRIISKLTSRTL